MDMSSDDTKNDSYAECRPLRNLSELLNFRSIACHAQADTPPSVQATLPNRPRMLFCHDFKGGYLLDRYHCHRDKLRELPDYNPSLDYRFDYWDRVDVFIYFSHHLVTVPPCSWIKQAHSNGVKILGTFIVEWNTKLAEELFAPENRRKVIRSLVEVCEQTGFDGWLFNMEVCINEKTVSVLIDFVREVRAQLAELRSGSLVLWYDSVITSGKICYQNELVPANKPFFDVCDGIFLNYQW
ncbi:endo beta N-acetylglucosaminidase-like [Tropilaelaps mercedesae]|uniref:Endo beta N-acetylglucosaminidase-like n=1 Tax=Tropilaelaps mercedesae TaxID=418985 RepID=A0A1V9XTK3_9ACAR|nr:endo beta N-acetylglucosaminidase-like [Tropilaelaps mercedesae]